MNYHNTRRSPSGFRSGAAPNHRAFDSPPRRSPGRGGGFRPMGGEGPGEYGFNGHQPPPPLVGQKRGFPASGRGGGSPGVFLFVLSLSLSCLVTEYLLLNRGFSFSTNFNCLGCGHFCNSCSFLEWVLLLGLLLFCFLLVTNFF